LEMPLFDEQPHLAMESIEWIRHGHDWCCLRDGQPGFSLALEADLPTRWSHVAEARTKPRPSAITRSRITQPEAPADGPGKLMASVPQIARMPRTQTGRATSAFRASPAPRLQQQIQATTCSPRGSLHPRKWTTGR